MVLSAGFCFLLTALLQHRCRAFAFRTLLPSSRPSPFSRAVVFSALSSNDNVPSDEMMRKDIELLREEAKQRLQTLSAQMEAMMRKKHPQRQQQSHFLDPSSFEDAELPLTSTKLDALEGSEDPGVADSLPFDLADAVDETQAATARDSEQCLARVIALPPRHHFADDSLLHGTFWKAVIKVGSSRVYGAAAAEEKPLLLHLVVKFKSEPLGESDDLLQGSANAKVLEVKESWIGASSLTEGRQRPVQVKSKGGWKILPGQGPKGIDILRFYLDVEEEICHDQQCSKLRCPASRIYCTSGFFSMKHHNEAEIYKTSLREELGRLVNQYEDLTLEDERDQRLISFEGVRRAKSMIDLRREIRLANKRIAAARIRDPEKALLRLSRKGDVGVTKEGQVCYKDESNGVSSEYQYLVLGKIEMASTDRRSRSNELRP